MTNRLLIIAALLALLTACGPTAKVDNTWVRQDVFERDLHGVLVVAVAKTEEGRRDFEQEFTEELEKHGIHAVASSSLQDGVDVTKEEVVAMGQEAGVDTVLVSLFAGRDTTTTLHPGRKYYAYSPVYGYDRYGRGGVYGVPYQVGQTSDFWAEHNSVHLTAKLYEIATEERLWQAFSGMEELSDVAAMRSSFIDSFMKDLADQGLIK